jgi:hypothetical protein
MKNQCQENMLKNKTSFSFKIDDNMQISKYQHVFFLFNQINFLFNQIK